MLLSLRFPCLFDCSERTHPSAKAAADTAFRKNDGLIIFQFDSRAPNFHTELAIGAGLLVDFVWNFRLFYNQGARALCNDYRKLLSCGFFFYDSFQCFQVERVNFCYMFHPASPA